jgi:phospholipid-binding lipoprotein MlaA
MITMDQLSWMYIVHKNKSRLNRQSLAITSSLALSLIISGCASYNDHPYEPQDPLQTVNRASFAFNQQFDRFILKPVAVTYKTITPDPVRDCVNNFYWNLDEIPTTINNVLQVEPKPALTSFTRLLINSTVGILGFFDVASHVGFERGENDFGTTLAKYGFTGSPYLVIPFLGPTNARDGLGLLVDYSYFTIWPYMRSVRLRNSLLAFDYVRIRANYVENDDVLDVAALDKYTLLRDAYIQRRALQMAQHGATWDQAKYYEDPVDDDLSPDGYWALDGEHVDVPNETNTTSTTPPLAPNTTPEKTPSSSTEIKTTEQAIKNTGNTIAEPILPTGNTVNGKTT